MNLTTSEVIKQGGLCYFSYLRAGFAYYNIDFNDNENGRTDTYMFAIPLDDIGNGSLHNQEKPITLMRWIRKAIESKEFIYAGTEISDLKSK